MSLASLCVHGGRPLPLSSPTNTLRVSPSEEPRAGWGRPPDRGLQAPENAHPGVGLPGDQDAHSRLENTK